MCSYLWSSSHYYRVIFLKNDFCDDYLFSDSNNSKGFWIGDSLYYYYPLCVYETIVLQIIK